MSGRRDSLSRIAPGPGAHAGLWIERGLPDHGQGAKQAHLDQTLAALRVPGSYAAFYHRWRDAVATLQPHTELALATARGRVVVGLGAESILETSVTLHRTYGVPYLPGSALKGLAASAAHQRLDDPAWRKAGPGQEMGAAHRTLFGDTESSGYVTFHDALWVPDGTALPLRLDVMTVHHAEYYGGKDAPPADWDSPNPVAFTTAHGTFLLAVTGPADWAGAAMDVLIGALAGDGIGAKTAAGYGRMDVQRLTPAARRPPDGPRGPGLRPAWDAWVRSISMGNADRQVPRLLSELAGEDRRLAAERVAATLGKALRDPKHKDKEWVRQLLAAVGESS